MYKKVFLCTNIPTTWRRYLLRHPPKNSRKIQMARQKSRRKMHAYADAKSSAIGKTYLKRHAQTLRKHILSLSFSSLSRKNQPSRHHQHLRHQPPPPTPQPPPPTPTTTSDTTTTTSDTNHHLRHHNHHLRQPFNSLAPLCTPIFLLPSHV